ncbi:MAG: SpoIIE family protein phosphatase [Acidobacteriota bacterium]
MTDETQGTRAEVDGRRSRVGRLAHGFLSSLPGRLILAGAAVKLSILALGAAGMTVDGLPGAVSTLGGVLLAVGAVVALVQGSVAARRRLLWRVRQKLLLSYLFIGVLPVLLVVIIFVLAGLLLFANLSSYLIRDALTEIGAEARLAARSLAIELSLSPGRPPGAVVNRWYSRAAGTATGLSIAIVPIAAARCDAGVGSQPGPGMPAASATDPAASADTAPLAVVGPWRHEAPPPDLPDWLGCREFTGVVAAPKNAAEADASGSAARVTVRAVSIVRSPRPAGVVVDIPFEGAVRDRVEASTGVTIGDASLVGDGAAVAAPAASTRVATESIARGRGFPWVALLDHTEWRSGQTQPLPLRIGISVRSIYARLSASQASLGTRSFGDLLVIAVLLVALLFLIIQAGALAMGFVLARSITGSVHELFVGTERVRQGDFGHRIAVRTRDQLGQLADSFNLMTGSIEDLLRQAAEKRRLEEEMRLAHEIQTSLLPNGPLDMPGVRVSALCVPAREVGGDYYDVLPLPDGRFGVLVADVSGKGMSAALYMAELKGLILSLSQIHESPRQLLINANRVISAHLDSRSFITMTYAVVDPKARRMTYARAGHTPLIHLARDGRGGRRTRILTPDGMVLGLRIDDGQRFESLLAEETLELGSEDILVFFTDGISEAMNERSDCFGESRLATLIEAHADLGFEEMRERILREIEAFVGNAPQHDDMTMIILKVQDAAA